jgi:hypothetical protein
LPHWHYSFFCPIVAIWRKKFQELAKSGHKLNLGKQIFRQSSTSMETPTEKNQNIGIWRFRLFLSSLQAMQNTSKLLHFGNFYLSIRFFGEILPGKKKKKVNTVVKVR